MGGRGAVRAVSWSAAAAGLPFAGSYRSAIQWLVSGEDLPPPLPHILPPRCVLCPTGSEKMARHLLSEVPHQYWSNEANVPREAECAAPVTEQHGLHPALPHSEEGSSH